jgi:hypothetical protein
VRVIIGDAIRRIRERLSNIPLVGPGARIALRSGRIVRVRPLNLYRALQLLGLVSGMIERVGWEHVGEAPLISGLLKVIEVNPEEIGEGLSLLTGEPPEVVFSEFTPGDAVRVFLAAWEQESSQLSLLGAKSRGDGGKDV